MTVGSACDLEALQRVAAIVAGGNRSAQFEHIMVIARGAPVVVTVH